MAGFDGFFAFDLLSAAIDDETTSQPVNLKGRTDVVLYLSGAGTITSGVVTIEESLPLVNQPSEGQPYGGTWSSITTVNAATVTGGVQAAIHLEPASYGYVRARVSTAIGGGGSVTMGGVAV